MSNPTANGGEMLYNYAKIADSAAQIGATAHRIKAQLDDLEVYVKRLVSTWSGQAATDYQQAQNNWNTAADDINNILHKLAGAVGDGNTHMEHVDKMAAASWSV